MIAVGTAVATGSVARPLTRAERKEETRRALLAAAADLFARQGIEATSTQQVADAVGLTRGALYASFRTREELVRAVGEAQSVFLDLDCLWRTDLPLAERLGLLGAELFRLARREGDRLMVLDLEYLLYTPRHPEESADRHLRYAAAAEEIGGRLQGVAHERGEQLPLPPTLFASALIALLRGLWQEEMRQRRHFEEQQMVAVLRLLAGQPATRTERTTGIEPA